MLSLVTVIALALPAPSHADDSVNANVRQRLGEDQPFLTASLRADEQLCAEPSWSLSLKSDRESVGVKTPTDLVVDFQRPDLVGEQTRVLTFRGKAAVRDRGDDDWWDDWIICYEESETIETRIVPNGTATGTSATAPLDLDGDGVDDVIVGSGSGIATVQVRDPKTGEETGKTKEIGAYTVDYEVSDLDAETPTVRYTVRFAVNEDADQISNVAVGLGAGGDDVEMAPLRFRKEQRRLRVLTDALDDGEAYTLNATAKCDDGASASASTSVVANVDEVVLQSLRVNLDEETGEGTVKAVIRATDPDLYDEVEILINEDASFIAQPGVLTPRRATYIARDLDGVELDLPTPKGDLPGTDTYAVSVNAEDGDELLDFTVAVKNDPAAGTTVQFTNEDGQTLSVNLDDRTASLDKDGDGVADEGAFEGAVTEREDGVAINRIADLIKGTTRIGEDTIETSLRRITITEGAGGGPNIQYSTASNGDDEAEESVSLSFGKLQIVYKSISGDGSTDTTTTAETERELLRTVTGGSFSSTEGYGRTDEDSTLTSAIISVNIYDSSRSGDKPVGTVSTTVEVAQYGEILIDGVEFEVE
ncbi:MAG: hypothetical protein AAFV53_03575 [Myxococcota bacterium]